MRAPAAVGDAMRLQRVMMEQDGGAEESFTCRPSELAEGAWECTWEVMQRTPGAADPDDPCAGGGSAFQAITRVGADGILVPGQPGYKLDGTVAAPCVASTISLAERANALPMGPATVTVQGTDSGGTERDASAGRSVHRQRRYQRTPALAPDRPIFGMVLPTWAADRRF